MVKGILTAYLTAGSTVRTLGIFFSTLIVGVVSGGRADAGCPHYAGETVYDMGKKAWNVDQFVTIDQFPASTGEALYYALSFGTDSSSFGYMGVQTLGNGDGKAIFSIWNAADKSASPNTGANCVASHGSEDGGKTFAESVQCTKFSVVAGHTYRYRLWKIDGWGAWIMDMNTGVETYLGKIGTPTDTQIDTLQNFTEMWGGAGGCEATKIKSSAIVNYHRPTFNNVAYTAQWKKNNNGLSTFVPFPGSNKNLYAGEYTDFWSGQKGASAAVSTHVVCAADSSAVNVDHPTCMHRGHFGQDCNTVCGGVGELDALHFPAGQAVSVPQCLTTSIAFNGSFRGDATEVGDGKWGCSISGPPGNPAVWRHTNGAWDAAAHDDNIARFCACKN